jgi:alpha-tubulin suppressor-like RCC1 family protein
MKNYLIYYLFITLSIFLNSCSEGFKEKYSKISIVLAEVTAITTPTTDTTPDYTFSSTESGAITYGGSCSSSTTSAISGNNTITLSSLSDGPYADCTITVSKTISTENSETNLSDSLTITPFTVSSAVSSSDDSSSDTAIAAGQYHSCAILDNGSVKCWGYNNNGQLGIDNTTNMGDNSGEMAVLPVVNLGTGRTATAISLHANQSCALLDNASVKCWGSNQHGRLGLGNNNSIGDQSGEMAALTGIDLGTGRTATAIAAGGNHTCALLDNASVKCWGRNQNGQLGIGNTEHMGNTSNEMGDDLPSIDLGTGRTATAIAAGYFHTCALLDNASVKCWGRNSEGQLGLGNTTQIGDNSNEMGDNLPSIDLGTGRTATAIAAGAYLTCALLDNGAVKCWGDNNIGQLGIGNTTDMGDNSGEMGDDLPSIDLGTGRTATAIASIRNHHCAILDNASVKCWGENAQGQLGIDNTNLMGDETGDMGDNLPSIDLGTGRTATAIAAGYFHSCAALDNGAVKCWGDNFYGQLGIGTTDDMGNNTGEMAALTGIDL